jgi:hypothetical protein
MAAALSFEENDMQLRYVDGEQILFEACAESVPPPGSTVTFRTQWSSVHGSEGTLIGATVSQHVPSAYHYDLAGALSVVLSVDHIVVEEPPLTSHP